MYLSLGHPETPPVFELFILCIPSPVGSENTDSSKKELIVVDVRIIQLVGLPSGSVVAKKIQNLLGLLGCQIELLSRLCRH